jgi:hypothetical protein
MSEKVYVKGYHVEGYTTKPYRVNSFYRKISNKKKGGPK